MNDTILDNQLSRRERQIMDAVLKLRKATVADVQDLIPEPPSYSAVRRMMVILEEKGFLNHEVDGKKYIYSARIDRNKAKVEALEHVTDTFFNGSPLQAAAALIDISANELTANDIEQLTSLLEKAKREGR